MQYEDNFLNNLIRYTAAIEKMKITGNKILQGMFSGIHKSPYFGFGSDFEENRGYNYGDNIKLINWPLWARTEKLYIKKFKETTNSDIIIVIDNSFSMIYPENEPTKFDLAKLYSGLLGLLFLNQMDRVGLFPINGENIVEPLRGNDAKDIFIQYLLKLKGVENISLNTIANYFSEYIYRRSIVILISDFIFPHEELENFLNHLHFQNHLIIALQIFHREENNPNIIHGIYFDPENKKRALPINKFSKKSYLEALKNWKNKIKNLLISKEILSFQLSTDLDPLAFLTYLEERSNKWNF